eukprot:SAG22_NODE_6970_length_789_cov_0.963768_2_plen_23_part_01
MNRMRALGDTCSVTVASRFFAVG